ncbi:hypothetical protein [Dermacoccus abyssi]|uniref:hypothetical protein n=1 Tax=Dermacoccus abyssi TaxID=322596 RepID=UPI002AD20329|nr:hypothetical protein [Dermacoccus abyssi]
MLARPFSSARALAGAAGLGVIAVTGASAASALPKAPGGSSAIFQSPTCGANGTLVTVTLTNGSELVQTFTASAGGSPVSPAATTVAPYASTTVTLSIPSGAGAVYINAGGVGVGSLPLDQCAPAPEPSTSTPTYTPTRTHSAPAPTTDNVPAPGLPSATSDVPAPTKPSTTRSNEMSPTATSTPSSSASSSSSSSTSSSSSKTSSRTPSSSASSLAAPAFDDSDGPSNLTLAIGLGVVLLGVGGAAAMFFREFK